VVKMYVINHKFITPLGDNRLVGSAELGWRRIDEVESVSF